MSTTASTTNTASPPSPVWDGDGVRVYHGDALEVLPGLEPGSVDCVIADPPFGARQPCARRTAGEQFKEVVGNDRVRPEWLTSAFASLKDGGAAYVFTCWDVMGEWRTAMKEAGFRVRSCIVWDKVIHGTGDLEGQWAPQHELILFASKGRHKFIGSRPKDVITCQRVSPAQLVHPYQKPLGVIAPLIKASVPPGGLVVDTHAGSGAVPLACLKSGRCCIAIEIDSDYADLITRRLSSASTPLFDALDADTTGEVPSR